jgi:hypothetical protein
MKSALIEGGTSGDIAIEIKGIVPGYIVNHALIETNYRKSKPMDYEGIACGANLNKIDIKKTGRITCNNCKYVIEHHPAISFVRPKYEVGESFRRGDY